MTQEELVKFLKDNLRIEFTSDNTWETTELGVCLYLGDELISSDYASV